MGSEYCTEPNSSNSFNHSSAGKTQLPSSTPAGTETQYYPLHYAVLHRNTTLVQQLLSKDPALSLEKDTRGYLSLHVACALGYAEMILILLRAQWSHEACFIPDNNGMLPIHVAAAKGQTVAIELLLAFNPKLIWSVTAKSETALHLCVIYHQITTLRRLVELNDDMMLLNAVDNEGNTVLHVAASIRQVVALTFLLGLKKMEVNIKNKKGLTAMDLLLENKNTRTSIVSSGELIGLLRRAGCKRSHELFFSTASCMQAPRNLGSDFRNSHMLDQTSTLFAKQHQE